MTDLCETGSTDPIVGRVGMITVNGLSFEVRVIGVRKRYGHTDYKIMPVRGGGNRWAESNTILFD